MRVLHRDPRTGEIKLRVENADDLWHLHNLVLPGDQVRASTYRREEVKTDKVRPERGEKVRVTLTIRVPGHGKMFPSGDAQSVYFDEILTKLRVTEIGEALVLVGPGFTRDAFLEYLKAREPALASKVHSHGTAHAGMQGIQEALKAGVGAKVFGDSRVAYEIRLVEKLLEAIATNGPCAYGPAEVAEAVDAGAVETLLVSDADVRYHGIEDLLRSAEYARGAVVLVSRHQQAEQKLEALGGIAALLRFPIK